MQKIARHLIAMLCMAALVCGGQLNVCTCELVAPPSTCESHDHSDHNEAGHIQHDTESGQSDAGCDSQCPCATCHSCHHAQVVLPGMVVGVFIPKPVTAAPETPTAPPVRPADIFDPPKLS